MHKGYGQQDKDRHKKEVTTKKKKKKKIDEQSPMKKI
jgi:hypothetical protein